MQPFYALLLFLAVRDQSILPISLKVTSLVLGQSCFFQMYVKQSWWIWIFFQYESTKKWQHTNDKTKQNKKKLYVFFTENS